MHTGVVEAINGNNCYVRILQNSACSGCSAQHLCNSSESKEKTLTVLLNGEDIKVGETVNIEGTVVQGLRAVYICYVIPSVLLIASVYLGVKFGGDMLGVFLSLGVLTVYFVVLYLFRNRIGEHFGFTLHKISNN